MFNVFFIIKFLNLVFLMVSMVYTIHLPQEQNREKIKYNKTIKNK